MAAATKLDKIKAQRDRARAQIIAFKEEKAGVIERGVQAALAGGTTFGLAYWKNRYPARGKVLGIPVETVLAALALGAVATELAGDREGEIFGIGVGAVCELAHSKGAEMGFKDLQESKKKS